MNKSEKLFGEMLLKKGLISEVQLQSTIQEQLQVQKNKLIGEMFVEKGLITENDLFRTLADQFGIEFVNLAEEEIDWEVSVGFSSSLINEHKCLPYRIDDKTITLAISNPLDAWLLEMAEKEADPNKIKVVLVKTSDMNTAIKEYHKRSIRSMMKKWKKD